MSETSDDTAPISPEPKKRGGQLLTTEDFIKRATEIHGDRYSYDRAVYAGSVSLLEIGCSVHGYFSQKPHTHYAGGGCPPCGKERHREALTNDFPELLRRAAAIHSGRYAYPEQEYQSMLHRITITCAVHGDFDATLNNHIYSASGCPSCCNDEHSARSRLGTEEFIARATLVHGDAFDYSQVDYTTCVVPVSIICPVHGAFMQRPENHLSGDGCGPCGFEGRRLTTTEFIGRSVEFWGDRFDYSRITDTWTPTRSRVPIVCALHGEFTSLVYDHLRGRGCMRCAESQPEREIHSLLSGAGIEYVAQWTHPTLRSKRRLRVDFAIPSQMVLIEYDGIFHFRPVRRGFESEADALRSFYERQARDRLKDEWAADNGWHLLRLSDQRNLRRDLVEAGVLSATSE